MVCRFLKIDYLSATGVYEFIFVGSLPTEVAEFKNLSLPFDDVTWASCMGALIAVSIVLYVVEMVAYRTLHGTEEEKHDGEY